jgi:MGT family glycosyltransferase
MTIPIFTLGSYGDVRPYLALARGLVQRGYDAYVSGPDEYATWAESAGVPFRGLGSYPMKEITDVLAAMAAEPDELQHPKILTDMTRENVVRLGKRAIELARDADVVVTHNICAYGYAAAHVNGKPSVTCHLFPALIPSSQTNVFGRSWGAIGNRLFWMVARRIVRNADPSLNATFERLGVPARRDWMLDGLHSKQLNLVAISPHVVARDRVWPAHYESIGYLHLAERAHAPDPRLAEFVESGDPPVVITFGSMFGVDATALTQLLLDALAKSGRRAVLQSGWAGLGDMPLPPNVHRTEFVSHEWLFPRAACVVHHGGAGTTGAALRAGVPSVIAYHLGDQQFWARHTGRLGVATATLTQKKLTADWLAKQIDRALHDEPLRERARKLGEAIRAEDGVARAIELIEEKCSLRCAASVSVA